jgi:hypothetical protein
MCLWISVSYTADADQPGKETEILIDQDWRMRLQSTTPIMQSAADSL